MFDFLNERNKTGSKLRIGSVCNRCQNRGWILPSNRKLKPMVKNGGLEPCYDNIKESEGMIKCDCGR
jgi:hypothetical protein